MYKDNHLVNCLRTAEIVLDYQLSDWDLLILLKEEKITPEIEEEITFPLYDLEFETGELISPMIYSENEWNSKYKVTPFYNNVMREGKLL